MAGGRNCPLSQEHNYYKKITLYITRHKKEQKMNTITACISAKKYLRKTKIISTLSRVKNNNRQNYIDKILNWVPSVLSMKYTFTPPKS